MKAEQFATGAWAAFTVFECFRPASGPAPELLRYALMFLTWKPDTDVQATLDTGGCDSSFLLGLHAP